MKRLTMSILFQKFFFNCLSWFYFLSLCFFPPSLSLVNYFKVYLKPCVSPLQLPEHYVLAPWFDLQLNLLVLAVSPDLQSLHWLPEQSSLHCRPPSQPPGRFRLSGCPPTFPEGTSLHWHPPARLPQGTCCRHPTRLPEGIRICCCRPPALPLVQSCLYFCLCLSAWPPGRPPEQPHLSAWPPGHPPEVFCFAPAKFSCCSRDIPSPIPLLPVHWPLDFGFSATAYWTCLPLFFCFFFQ